MNAEPVKRAQRTRGVGDAGHEASLVALANEVLRAAGCIQVPPKGRPRLHSAWGMKQRVACVVKGRSRALHSSPHVLGMHHQML